MLHVHNNLCNNLHKNDVIKYDWTKFFQSNKKNSPIFPSHYLYVNHLISLRTSNIIVLKIQ